MADSYFVLVAGDDGFSIECLSKELLEDRLDPEDPYWGSANFVETMPTEADPNYWGNRAIIIKGSLVVPRAVEVVTKVELP